MRRLIVMAVAAASLIAVIAAPLVAGDGARRFSAKLQGFSEVPAVSTGASGTFSARVNQAGTELTYRVSYKNLQGSVLQAHIHFAQPDVNGGIVIWLCGTAANPGPAGTPVCPQTGTVERTVIAGDVVNTAAAQGIAAGEFAEVLRAMRAGVTYANVHSSLFPGGEIRGRIGRSDSDD